MRPGAAYGLAATHDNRDKHQTDPNGRRIFHAPLEVRYLGNCHPRLRKGNAKANTVTPNN